jgi:ligand-binding sensor domain-containing protein
MGYGFSQDKGVFYSDDSGESWEKIEGLPNNDINVLKSDPVSAGRLWVGTDGGGAFRVDLPKMQAGRQ